MPHSNKTQDIRWKQRFQNFNAALTQLQTAVDLAKQRPLTDLEKLGLIQAFEFTHELAWNVLKDYFVHQGGATLITGSRDATREASTRGLLAENGAVWMEMIRSRNQTSHTYNQNIAEEIVHKITEEYMAAFLSFQDTMKDFVDHD